MSVVSGIIKNSCVKSGEMIRYSVDKKEVIEILNEVGERKPNRKNVCMKVTIKRGQRNERGKGGEAALSTSDEHR